RPALRLLRKYLPHDGFLEKGRVLTFWGGQPVGEFCRPECRYRYFQDPGYPPCGPIEAQEQLWGDRSPSGPKLSVKTDLWSRIHLGLLSVQRSVHPGIFPTEQSQSGLEMGDQE